MTAQFRYVAGHIEVYSATGEFLFSADTMQEAWEDYQDEMSARRVQVQLQNIQNNEIVYNIQKTFVRLYKACIAKSPCAGYNKDRKEMGLQC